jgi:hypothetical protein
VINAHQGVVRSRRKSKPEAQNRENAIIAIDHVERFRLQVREKVVNKFLVRMMQKPQLIHLRCAGARTDLVRAWGVNSLFRQEGVEPSIFEEHHGPGDGDEEDYASQVS